MIAPLCPLNVLTYVVFEGKALTSLAVNEILDERAFPFTVVEVVTYPLKSTAVPNSCQAEPSQAYSLPSAVICHTSPVVFPLLGNALTVAFVPL